MPIQELYLDIEGNLWLLSGDEEGLEAFGATLLGPPTDERYRDVPRSLWEELERLIDEANDADSYSEAYRREVEATYRRQQL